MVRFLAVMVGVACLMGCRGAPVQEMSDARQAIEAARVAGASERAPGDLEEAQAAIARAESHIQAQEFGRARREALDAKRYASAALANAEHPQSTALPKP